MTTNKLREANVKLWAASEGILKRGKSGPDVAFLQAMMDLFGFEPGPHDGIFGSRTEAACADCQRELLVTHDGLCGPITRARAAFAFDHAWARGRPLPIVAGGPEGYGRHHKLGWIPHSYGKMSNFGGPHDSGDRELGQAIVRGAASPQALIEKQKLLVELGVIMNAEKALAVRYGSRDRYKAKRGELFFGGDLSRWPETRGVYKRNKAGTSSMLDPDSFYCAMRFPRSMRRRMNAGVHRVLVRSPSTGKSCILAPTDYGPGAWVGRVIDISPGSERYLGIRTDDHLMIAWAEDGAPLGPVGS